MSWPVQVRDESNCTPSDSSAWRGCGGMLAWGKQKSPSHHDGLSHLVTPRVARWVERIHWALTRYGEGEYVEAARLADITGASKYFEWFVPREGRGTR